VYKVFRYRLYPTAAQRARLDSMLETCRWFCNDCLSERKVAYETEGRTISKVEQFRRVKIYKTNNPFAAGIHSHILQVVVSDLDKTFQAFFRRINSLEKKDSKPEIENISSRILSKSMKKCFISLDIEQNFLWVL
jgi:putative transposase